MSIARTRRLLSLMSSLSLTGLTAASTPVVLKPTYKVRIERAVMIPMRDGTRLSADLIRPDAEGRFAAIVMYHPYRKDDVGRGGVERRHGRDGGERETGRGPALLAWHGPA